MPEYGVTPPDGVYAAKVRSNYAANRTNVCTMSTASAFVIVYDGQIVIDLNCGLRTLLLAFRTGNTSAAAYFPYNGAFIDARADDRNPGNIRNC
ncbi:hypothetical protein SDC9_159737 [bioreactor metagenome]|uniref:Uncharacterized protein n=1 Tax=bioreactor metagenome TaxID=1076179 RepID=A0A645FGE6_9ZZZZ